MQVSKVHVWKTTFWDGPRWIIDIYEEGKDSDTIKIISSTPPQVTSEVKEIRNRE